MVVPDVVVHGLRVPHTEPTPPTLEPGLLLPVPHTHVGEACVGLVVDVTHPARLLVFKVSLTSQCPRVGVGGSGGGETVHVVLGGGEHEPVVAVWDGVVVGVEV